AEVEAAIAGALDRHRPELLLIPAAIGCHRDHLLLREIGREQAEARGQAHAYYEDLPYAAEWNTRWVERWMTAFAPAAFPVRVPVADGDKAEGLKLYTSQLGPKEIGRTLAYARQWHPAAERLWAPQSTALPV